MVVFVVLRDFLTVNWCCFGCVDGVERFLHSELVCFDCICFFTVQWCVLVMLIALTGFFTLNWCVVVALMALTASFTEFCCVEARCAGSLPGPP